MGTNLFILLGRPAYNTSRVSLTTALFAIAYGSTEYLQLGRFRTGIFCVIGARCAPILAGTGLQVSELDWIDHPQANHGGLCAIVAVIGCDVVGHGHRSAGSVQRMDRPFGHSR